MSNELNIPVGGIGPEGAFTVECLGQKFAIRYVVNMRSGANMGMVVDTIKHFKHAIQCLAIGGKKPNAAVGERDTYSDKIEHGDSRANTWTLRSFAVVPVGDKIFKVPINICNEFTSAAQLISLVWFGVDVMDSEDMVDDFIQAGSIMSPGVSAPKPKSALDEAFPRGEDGKPVNNSTPPPTPEANTIAINAWRGSEREDLEREHLGKTIQIAVAAIERDEKVFDNSNRKEFIHFYPTYQDGIGEYPLHYKLDIDMGKDWDVSNAKKSGLLELVPDLGMRRKVAGVASYRITADKRDGVNAKGVPYKDIRYWNFKEFVAAPQAATTEPDTPPEFDDTGWERDANNPDDIAF